MDRPPTTASDTYRSVVGGRIQDLACPQAPERSSRRYRGEHSFPRRRSIPTPAHGGQTGPAIGPTRCGSIGA